MASFSSLAPELLLHIAEHLHNIEDYAALASTCRHLRSTLESVGPRTILRLANNQSRVFFRPSPEFLVAATARQLGEWARLDPANEQTLAAALQNGVEGMLDLALLHCGLTMSRIRELHALRFSVINPVTNIIDQCVGRQWYSIPNFWDTVDDAYTIDSDPDCTFLHLAIYGELFAPDLDAYLDGNTAHRPLSVETRLEFIKYCVPDFACEQHGNINPRDAHLPSGELDPRRAAKPVGPYAKKENSRSYIHTPKDNNVALVWVLKSTRWRPHWRAVRQKAAVEDFQEDYEEAWWNDGGEGLDWRQRLWENIMVCQGLEGLGMITPEFQDAWLEKIRTWRDKIAALEKPPGETWVGSHVTYDYPFIFGDLRICASGFVGGS